VTNSGSSTPHPAVCFLKYGDAIHEFAHVSAAETPEYDGMRSYMQEIRTFVNGRPSIVVSAGARNAAAQVGNTKLFVLDTHAPSRIHRIALALGSAARLWRILCAERPGLFVLLDPGNYAIVAAAYAVVARARLVFAVPGEITGSRFVDKLRGRVFAFLARRTFVAAVLSRSDSISRDLKAMGVPEERVVRYYPYYDRTLRELPSKPDAPPGVARTVGFLGRVSRVKGVEDLVPLARHLCARGLGRLVVVGDGPEADQLSRALDDANVSQAVQLMGRLGHRAAMAELGTFDCLAVPSRREGVCKTAVEAAILGVPIVAYDVGGLAEVVRNGVNGFLVPPGDLEGFIGAVSRVLTDDGLRRDLVRGAESVGESLLGRRPTFDEALDGVWPNSEWQRY
jgi:glycosyltransferase involved in cell wall biosynthesis